MLTLLDPPVIGCLHVAGSPTLAASLPFILTLLDPFAILGFV